MEPRRHSPGENWERFNHEYPESIRRREAAIFVGAGLSFGSGLPSWDELIGRLADDARVDLPANHGLAPWNVAQYIANNLDRRHRSEFDQTLLRSLGKAGTLQPTHRQIAHLGLDVLWTSNYDSLIESAYEQWQGPGQLDVVVTAKDLARARRGSAVLFKLHGTSSEGSSMVLTRADYAGYRSRNEALYTALLNDLLRRSFLFLGFSFVDPNVMGLVSEAARISGEEPRSHFVMFGEQDLKKPGEALRHADLESLGIVPLYVRDWTMVPRRLEEIRHRVAKKRVLVSGSDGGSSIRKDRIPVFANQLGRMLIRKDYTIVCGLNPAVGRPVINGALEELVERGEHGQFSERVRVWPLPTGADAKTSRDDYRHAMAAVAGIGVFLGGGGGTEREHEAFAAPSQEHGGFESGRAGHVIPVAAFGGTGRELWKKRPAAIVTAHPELADDFLALDDGADADMVDAVGRLLDVLSETPAPAEGTAPVGATVARS